MASNSHCCGSQRARRSGPRKPGFAATTGGAQKEEGSPETAQERPRLLAGPLWNLVPLAKGLAHGPAENVVGLQRKSLKNYWARISGGKSAGRPEVGVEVRALIKQMAAANAFWGAPRIHGELLKLGIEISERTVSRL